MILRPLGVRIRARKPILRFLILVLRIRTCMVDPLAPDPGRTRDVPRSGVSVKPWEVSLPALGSGMSPPPRPDPGRVGGLTLPDSR